MDIRYKKKLIDDIAALINIPDNLAQSFDFKVKEMRDMYQDEIRQHNEFKGLVEGKKLDIKFEMEYIKADWTVSVPGVPDFDTGNIPMEIITHITNNASSTGIIKIKRKTLEFFYLDILFKESGGILFHMEAQINYFFADFPQGLQQFENSIFKFPGLFIKKII